MLYPVQTRGERSIKEYHRGKISNKVKYSHKKIDTVLKMKRFVTSLLLCKKKNNVFVALHVIKLIV